MCRYVMSHYRTSYVCVPCRHVAQYRPYELTGQPRCPSCSAELVLAGRDFQAPRKRNRAGWAAVGALLARGANYDSCGCTGPGYRPRTLAVLRQGASSG